jgi:hypothetical protein
MKKFTALLLLFFVVGFILPQQSSAQSFEIQNISETVSMQENNYLLEIIKKLQEQIDLLRGGAVLEELELLQPDAGQIYEEGRSVRVSWRGGITTLPVTVRFLTDSANYYCVKDGGKICPQDISESVTALTLDNDKKENILLPVGLTGRFIVEICQYRGVCDFTAEPITVRAR